MVKTKGQIDALVQLIGAQTDFIAKRLSDAGISRATFDFEGDNTVVTAVEPLKNDTRAVHCLRINDRKMTEYSFGIVDSDGNMIA